MPALRSGRETTAAGGEGQPRRDLGQVSAPVDEVLHSRGESNRSLAASRSSRSSTRLSEVRKRHDRERRLAAADEEIREARRRREELECELLDEEEEDRHSQQGDELSERSQRTQNWVSQSGHSSYVSGKQCHTPVERGFQLPLGVDIKHQQGHKLIRQKSTRTHPAANVDVPLAELKGWIARKKIAEELPAFEGDPTKWPMFMHMFERSTSTGKYTEDENLLRLQKALKGEAKECVEALLSLPGGLPRVLDRLKRKYGKPDTIIKRVMAKLETVPSMGEVGLSGLETMASQVENAVATVVLLGRKEYLYNPVILDRMVRKLNVYLRLQWGEYVRMLGDGPLSLEVFSFWIQDKAEIVGGIDEEQEKGQVTEQKGSEKPLVKREGLRRYCQYCDLQSHTLEECRKFAALAIEERQKWARARFMCFVCLRRGHRSSQCNAKVKCKFCESWHHSLLHSKDQTVAVHLELGGSQSVEEGSDYSAPENDIQRNHTVGERSRNSAPENEPEISAVSVNPGHKILLRVLPIVLEGPKKTIKTYAFLDSGSTVTMIDQNTAHELGISGPNKPLRVCWSDGTVREEEQSCEVMVPIAGVHNDAKRFQLNARTVTHLELPTQSVDIQSLGIECRRLGDLEISSYQDGKPKVLIGEDNWPLTVPLKTQFWKCINETQTKGDSKTWKSCCNHAMTDQCNNGCEMAELTSDLVQHCRQSDEMYLFDCVEIKQDREECCGLARKPECHNMCRRWVISSAQISKSLLANTCSSPVINCLATLMPRVPLRQPHKYLHCCEHSTKAQCRDTCRNSLKKQLVDLDRLQENLDAAGCQPVSFHDKMWQCFLRSNQDPPIGNFEDPKTMHAVMRPPGQDKKTSAARVGVNDAKLHCCRKAAGVHCKKLCIKIFSTDFDWEAFEKSCDTPREENMNQCLDEVTEPCQLGCKNLNFCTMFNNRPLELFRSCSADSDKAARADYDTWVNEKKIILPNMDPLYVKEVKECTPIYWKTVACALQLKPCDRRSQSTRICKSSCYKLLNACLDESRLRRVSKEAKIAEVCNKLASSSPDDTNCVSLDPFLEQVGDNVTDEYTTPCIPDTCGPAKFCEIRHHCSKEKDCDQTVCQSGCPVGQVAAYLVPTDAFVPIPTTVGKNCFKICQCRGRITDCESLYCIQQDFCKIPPDSDIDFSSTTENAALVSFTPSERYTGYTSERIRHSTTTISSRTTNEIPSMKTIGGYSVPPTRLPQAGPSLQHGSTLYIKCNLCVCFGGEITCSKRNCNETSRELIEPSFFQLPCNCEPKYEPVCTVTGLTLVNSCLAQCLGLKYSEGTCANKNACADGPGKDECPMCVTDHKVCLLKSESNCPQYQCVATSGCSYLPEDPVCDDEGATHKNPCFMLEAKKKMAYRGPCLTDCGSDPVCGVDGNTYESECHAAARYISVDYPGPCSGVGVVNNETGEIEGCAKDVKCPHPKSVTSCSAFIPPGACCPVCAGAIRLLYSQKHIERSSKDLNSKGSLEFTVENIMKSLSRHIDVAECALYGHLTMEMDLIVLVKSTVKEPSPLQLEVCTVEAEKLAVLIQRTSPRIATELSTSVLAYAKVVHFEYHVPGSSNALFVSPVVLITAYLITLAH